MMEIKDDCDPITIRDLISFVMEVLRMIAALSNI